MRMAATRASLFPDVFIPYFRMFGYVPFQQLPALAAVEIDHLDAVLAEPLDPAGKRPALTYNNGADPELPDEPATVPARRQRRNHDKIAIATLAPGAAEGVGFAVNAGVALLDAPVMSATQEFT